MSELSLDQIYTSHDRGLVIIQTGKEYSVFNTRKIYFFPVRVDLSMNLTYCQYYVFLRDAGTFGVRQKRVIQPFWGMHVPCITSRLLNMDENEVIISGYRYITINILRCHKCMRKNMVYKHNNMQKCEYLDFYKYEHD